MTLQEKIDIASEEGRREGIALGENKERLRSLDSVYTSLRKKGMSPSDVQSVLREAFRATDEEIDILMKGGSLASEEARREGIAEGITLGETKERLRNLDSVYTSLRKKGMSPSDMHSVMREAFRATDEEINTLMKDGSLNQI